MDNSFTDVTIVVLQGRRQRAWKLSSSQVAGFSRKESGSSAKEGA